MQLEVSDTGVGMDEAVKARIFDPFFTTKFTGRGLGLAAVQGIVRATRRRPSVSTVRRGKGTTFVVLLPASDRRTAVPKVAAGPVRPSVPRGTVVLIVDDEPTVRALSENVLARVGIRVLAGGERTRGRRSVP